ncbi:MAG: hypothetical protein R3C68_16725 [Myxococcota bacterium]
MRIVRSAKQHLFYALLVKPTQYFKYFALALLGIGLYESAMVAKVFLQVYQPKEEFWQGIWMGLSHSFGKSPHTVIIASVSLILSFQTLTFLALFQLLKLQQEETLKHILLASHHKPPDTKL